MSAAILILDLVFCFCPCSVALSVFCSHVLLDVCAVSMMNTDCTDNYLERCSHTVLLMPASSTVFGHYILCYICPLWSGSGGWQCQAAAECLCSSGRIRSGTSYLDLTAAGRQLPDTAQRINGIFRRLQLFAKAVVKFCDPLRAGPH